MKNIWNVVAGPSTSASDTQLSQEIKSIPTSRRNDLLKRANLKSKVNLSGKETLTLMETLGLSWRQMRASRKLLKRSSVHFENEDSIRALGREITSHYIEVENRLFLENTVEKYVEYGRVKGLSKFTVDLLDKYEENGMLTWHKNTIPDDQIWLKIGGDHGKHSFKMTLQVANLEKPNAQQNTFVIALSSIRDSHENIERFLNGGLGDEIAALSSLTWRNKKIVVFDNGDYEYLCKIYGLSRPQGTYPCLWCLATIKQIRENTVSPTPKHRNLQSLHTNHKAFVANGGIKKSVSQHNNCLHAPLSVVELDFVAPPYLHILLGVVLKHHQLLEIAAHKVDTQIMTRCRTADLTKLGHILRRYGSNWNTYIELKNQLIQLKTEIVMSNNETERKRIKKEKKEVKQNIMNLAFQELHPRSGPIASSLDVILTKNHITPQPYHSRSFIGNHCHKYTRQSVYTQLTNELIAQTQACTRDPFIVDDAHVMAKNFNTINEAFSAIHMEISHSRPIDKNTLPAIQEKIDTYMESFRRVFPRKTIPKHHILEHHCLPFIKRHGVGLGLLGEQGTESSHQTIAKLERRAHGIVDKPAKLKFIMNAQLLHCAPSFQSSNSKK